jgi:hypothetical protein
MQLINIIIEGKTMRGFATSLLAIGLIITPAIQADELSFQPAASVYWRVSFGGDREGRTAPTYGFRLDQLGSVSGQPNARVDYTRVLRSPAWADIQFGSNGLKGVRVKGRGLSPKQLSFDPTGMLIEPGRVEPASAISR